MQLDIYSTYNQMLRRLHDKGHNDRMAEFRERMAEISAERQKYLNTEEGESLSTDDFQDIYITAKAE
jgi:hypothetical protein